MVKKTRPKFLNLQACAEHNLTNMLYSIFEKTHRPAFVGQIVSDIMHDMGDKRMFRLASLDQSELEDRIWNGMEPKKNDK